jgi:hypothetical protein
MTKKPKDAYSIMFSQRRTVATCLASSIADGGSVYYLKAKAARSASHVGYAVIDKAGTVYVYTAAWGFVGLADTRAEGAQMIDSYHRKHNRARYWMWLDKPFWCGGRVARPAKRKAARR